MMQVIPPTCLTIAGSDSGGGAGIQADLKTFAALGCYGTSALTAITAQNSNGVRAIQGVDPDILKSQLEALFDDIPPLAIKTGMLYSRDIINVVADTLEGLRNAHSLPPVVVDPVMISTSGHTLLSEDAVETLRSRLIPLATVITPNIPEGAVLAGLGKDSIGSLDAMKSCARALGKLGPKYVLLKGGHLPLISNDSAKSRIVDVLYDAKSDDFTLIDKPQIQSRNTHGTGCTQSAALCAALATGLDVPTAVRKSSEYIRRAIAASYPKGESAGPVDHLHNLTRLIVPRPTQLSPHPFTDYLIAQTGDLWEKYVNHPFTLQLGKGTLPMKAFLFFIRQDYSFLLHYARTMALAAYKAKTYEELQASTFIISTVLHEVEMHIMYCKSQGISKEELEKTKESVTNIAYNRYVLDVSSAGSMLDLRIATAPCLLGYGEVGLRLANRPDTEVDRSKSNPYYEWAINYGKPEFQAAVKTGRELLEISVADEPLSQKRLDALSKIFTQTTELEIAFWDTALAAGQE